MCKEKLVGLRCAGEARYLGLKPQGLTAHLD
jgi:hypothetical protein